VAFFDPFSVHPGYNPGMDPIARAALSSWNWRVEVIIPLLILGALFVLGWRRLRAISGPPRHPRALGAVWRPASYLAGLGVIGLALLSPIDVLVQHLFFVHMIQHMLLIMIAPILLLLPNPLPFLLWGLPGQARLAAGGALNRVIHRESLIGSGLRRVTGPGMVWFLMIVFIIGWHDPALYNAALRSDFIHDLEHLTVFAAGMLFWWKVIGAGPRLHKNLSRAAKIVFIIAVIPPNMALGVAIAFSPEPLYTYYSDMPRLWGMSVLDDQRLSGILMWIPGSMMYFMAALTIIFLILSGEGRKPQAANQPWFNDEAMAAPGLAAGGE
jgi:cytochrome c oxidase assembly factor CtaG